MAADYEDLYDLSNLDDDEVHDLIIQELQEYGEIDTDLLDIQVLDGFITLGGTVGTEYELQVIENLITDLLGIANYSNEIIIDDLERALQSEAADEARSDRESSEVVTLLGDDDDRTDPEAVHLLENPTSELYGTQNLGRAIEQGEAYEPPDRPIQEGYWSEEDH